MIDFQNFGIEDTTHFKSYLHLCIQIPSNLSPLFLLDRRESFKLKRGYAANLCWHKFIRNGKEFWSAPVGDWDEINWQEVFGKHVPADTVFDNVPEYLVKLWQREFGETIAVEENRDLWDYILYLDRMENLEGKSSSRSVNGATLLKKIMLTPSKRSRRKFLTNCAAFKWRRKKIFNSASNTLKTPRRTTKFFCLR